MILLLYHVHGNNDYIKRIHINEQEAIILHILYRHVTIIFSWALTWYPFEEIKQKISAYFLLWISLSLYMDVCLFYFYHFSFFVHLKKTKKIYLYFEIFCFRFLFFIFFFLYYFKWNCLNDDADMQEEDYYHCVSMFILMLFQYKNILRPNFCSSFFPYKTLSSFVFFLFLQNNKKMTSCGGLTLFWILLGMDIFSCFSSFFCNRWVLYFEEFSLLFNFFFSCLVLELSSSFVSHFMF